MEADLAAARHFSQNPQVLIVFLLRLALITLAGIPIIIVGVILTQTSASTLIRTSNTALGIAAYVAIMFTVNMGVREAKRFHRFSEYEAKALALLQELRSKLPQPARRARSGKR